MADALVSVVLEQLGSMIAQKVEKEVAVTGVENEVQKLKSNFEAIEAVLADAEQRQLKEEYIKRWMGQLKDVSYDMDDVLDEWSTAIAKSQMKVNDELPPKTIRKMESLRKVGREFLGMEDAAADDNIGIGEMTPSNTIIAFPRLKSLTFWNLKNWEEWEGEGRRNEDKTIMPSLRSLRIQSCPKLKALSDYIYQSTTLEELRIIASPILEDQFKEGGKGWPNTSHTPNITF